MPVRRRPRPKLKPATDGSAGRSPGRSPRHSQKSQPSLRVRDVTQQNLTHLRPDVLEAICQSLLRQKTSWMTYEHGCFTGCIYE